MIFSCQAPPSKFVNYLWIIPKVDGVQYWDLFERLESLRGEINVWAMKVVKTSHLNFLKWDLVSLTLVHKCYTNLWDKRKLHILRLAETFDIVILQLLLKWWIRPGVPASSLADSFYCPSLEFLSWPDPSVPLKPTTEVTVGFADECWCCFTGHPQLTTTMETRIYVVKQGGC